MKNFLSQKLEIQIPNQKNYSGMTTMPTSHKSLIEFLKNNFKFPSDNPTDIANFICSDYELEKIIYDLPKIITNEPGYSHISLDFMKETSQRKKFLK